MSILYVDDDPGLLEVGRIFLERSGPFAVETVTSASAAMDLLKTREFDAIISDYMMPEMDGIAFLKKVRGSGDTIPFIILTGRGCEEVVIQALNEGATYYLQKGGKLVPQFTEIAHQIRHAVQQRRAEADILDLQRRECGVLNFLPDATFIIDSTGHVMLWNRAMEEMTGIAAAQMIGKGKYEYAIPFYGEQRPLLANLIDEPDKAIAKEYANVTREGQIVMAITTKANLKGRPVSLVVRASPLYNRRGEIAGAIESIREIPREQGAA
jgi:PAS domain S-box-containing protein